MLTKLGLDDLVRTTGAFLQGNFILSSGRSSNYYFDSKLLTLDPAGSQAVGEYFLDILRDTQAKAVGGMAHGAIPIVSAVTYSSELQGIPLPGFFVRSEPKAHGTQNLIEGRFPKDPNTPVAIIDDVVTGGDSILKAIRAVEEQGNPIVKVMCILDRDEGGREKIRDNGYELDSIFIIEKDSSGNAIPRRNGN